MKTAAAVKRSAARGGLRFVLGAGLIVIGALVLAVAGGVLPGGPLDGLFGSESKSGARAGSTAEAAVVRAATAPAAARKPAAQRRRSHTHVKRHRRAPAARPRSFQPAPPSTGPAPQQPSLPSPPKPPAPPPSHGVVENTTRTVQEGTRVLPGPVPTAVDQVSQTVAGICTQLGGCP